MPKVSFRMASASRESVLGVQTSTTRKNHRSGHTEGRFTTTPSGCCVRKGTGGGRGWPRMLRPGWRGLRRIRPQEARGSLFLVVLDGDVRITQRPVGAAQFGPVEGVPAVDVDVLADEGRQPGDVLV